MMVARRVGQRLSNGQKNFLFFSLIESKNENVWPGIDEKDAVRITPLFERFIRFSDITSARLN
jgi:hypothetical protein